MVLPLAIRDVLSSLMLFLWKWPFMIPGLEMLLLFTFFAVICCYKSNMLYLLWNAKPNVKTEQKEEKKCFLAGQMLLHIISVNKLTIKKK